MAETEFTETQSSKKKSKKKSRADEMSFLEHLEVLRWHIIRSALAIVVFSIIAFLNKHFIFDTVIFKPKTPEFWTNRMFAKLATLTGVDSLRINATDIKLVALKMADNFMTHVWTSIIIGMILASPYIIWEIWRFIRPALYEKERRHSSGAVLYMSILFIIGVMFGYFLISPLSIDFLGNYSISSEVTNEINMKSYIGVVTSVSLASGVIFELPIFVFFLSKIGILTPGLMKRYRRHAYVLLLLVSAIITPPDIFSQVMVCLPLVMLYELGIVISKKVRKKADAEFDAL